VKAEMRAINPSNYTGIWYLDSILI
jgi:hypothetical protein